MPVNGAKVQWIAIAHTSVIISIIAHLYTRQKTFKETHFTDALNLATQNMTTKWFTRSDGKAT